MGASEARRQIDGLVRTGSLYLSADKIYRFDVSGANGVLVDSFGTGGEFLVFTPVPEPGNCCYELDRSICLAVFKRRSRPKPWLGHAWWTPKVSNDTGSPVTEWPSLLVGTQGFDLRQNAIEWAYAVAEPSAQRLSGEGED